MKMIILALTTMGLITAVAALAQNTTPPPSGTTTAPAGDAIDWQRARELFQKESKGETLMPDEKAYLDRAKKARAANQGGKDRPGQDGGNNSGRTPTGTQPGNESAGTPPVRETTGCVPLTDMGDKTYKEWDGGLYGKGKNEPPPELAETAKKVATSIKPLDKDGKPSADGKIVLISLGMSNTTMEFSVFKQRADKDSAKSPLVAIVDCAQGSQEATRWSLVNTGERAGRPPWEVMAERLKAADVSDAQVQAVWIKLAIANPASDGDVAKQIKRFKDYNIIILHKLKAKFPNLQIAFLSSRIYAGYATTPLNPEPYAYEYGFACRDLILGQADGKLDLNWDPAKGAVKSPLLLWGPYLWADGTTPRKSDGLVWKKEDMTGNDGTHPSRAGIDKIVNLLMDFFKTNPYTKDWYLKK
ncbi:MAG: hypothetical protein HZA50_14050 [Planctomycetes bacterium]|nr:hypothetical protein [Planctomycetota bacterium]